MHIHRLHNWYILGQVQRESGSEKNGCNRDNCTGAHSWNNVCMPNKDDLMCLINKMMNIVKKSSFNEEYVNEVEKFLVHYVSVMFNNDVVNTM